jgi:aminopeptidase N
MEFLWTESYYGKDEGDYQRWDAMREWQLQRNLYTKAIVRRDFDDSSEFDGNAYGKGALALYMLRRKLGDPAFFAGLKHYLETNRGKNVVTADLVKAIEEATQTNVDPFFDQWVYGAGAPQFEISYHYDAEKKQIALRVKQTQKIEGRVGLFTVPVDVEVANGSGSKLYPVNIAKADETFTFPSASAPEMVIFDKGSQVLKSVDAKKETKEWIYQLKNAGELADRADAAVALGKVKGSDEAAAALGEALRTDKGRGLRIEAAKALGEMGSPAASKQLLNAMESVAEPSLRSAVVQALGSFEDDANVAEKLKAVAKKDGSYRAQAAALQAIGRRKPAGAYEILTAAVNEDSPDGHLRNAALRALGSLGDDKAVPLLREWAMAGKEFNSREAAIGSLARLEKGDKEITQLIAGYLNEPHFPIRTAAIFALGTRGDPSAVPALEALLGSNDLSIEMAPMIRRQLEHLRNPSTQGAPHSGTGGGAEASEPANTKSADDQRLIRLEQLVQEMNSRLKTIEGRLPPPTKP